MRRLGMTRSAIKTLCRPDLYVQLDVKHCVPTIHSHIIYSVSHKKGGSTFVIITLENLDRFL